MLFSAIQCSCACTKKIQAKNNCEKVCLDIDQKNNFEARDEGLHAKLFAENSENLRVMWEYTNMMFLFISAEDSTHFSRVRSKIEELNVFHEKFNTVPRIEEKNIISLFRTAMSFDNYMEEFLKL